MHARYTRVCDERAHFSMKVLVEDVEDALRRWRGGEAKVWLYHISMRRLAVRIQSPAEPEALYIVVIGCEHICGPFVWHDANPSVADERDPATGQNVCRVTDVAAGFELRCASWTIVRGPSNELDQTFDNFLGNSPKER